MDKDDYYEELYDRLEKDLNSSPVKVFFAAIASLLIQQILNLPPMDSSFIGILVFIGLVSVNYFLVPFITRVILLVYVFVLKKNMDR